MAYFEIGTDQAEKVIEQYKKKLATLLLTQERKIYSPLDVLCVEDHGGNLDVYGVWGDVKATSLEGNCGTVVVNEFSFVCYREQRVEVFTIVLNLIRKLAKWSDYGYMVATTQYQQQDERKSFKKAGWKTIKRFKNPRSSNFIQVWGRATR